MSVHYKFKSALDYDTVTFDGLHISVGDLKAAISQQKRIGKTSDFDLQITNAQTKEGYLFVNIFELFASHFSVKFQLILQLHSCQQICIKKRLLSFWDSISILINSVKSKIKSTFI